MSARSRREPGEVALDDRGAVLPFVGICLVLIVVTAALAVDLGRFSVAARETRNVVDIAALDAVRVMDGSSTSAQQPVVEAAAAQSAARNGFVVGTDGTLEVTLGVYDRSTRVFRATAPAEVPDAVRILAARENDNLFAPGSFTAHRSATASAAAVGSAGIGIATTTVAVDTTRSAVLNALLGDLLGTSVNLTAADWQALATTNVTLADLAQLGLGLDPTAVGQLLDEVWSVRDLIAALARTPLGTAAATALAPLVGLGAPPENLRLGDVIHADLTRPGAHRFALSVVDLLESAVMASGRNRTVVVGLDASTFGLAALTVQVHVVEPPQFAFGPVGTTVQSAQVRATVDSTLLGQLAVAGIEPATVHLPLVLDTGRGAAEITAIGCGGTGSPTSVSVTGTTAAATVRVAQPTGPAGSGAYGPATLVTVSIPGTAEVPPVPVVRIDADVLVPVLTGSGGLVFAPPYGWQPTQRVSAAVTPGDVLQLPDAQLVVIPLGVPLPLPLDDVVDPLVNTLLNPALNALVPPLLRALGTDLGIADISVPIGTCSSAALVE